MVEKTGQPEISPELLSERRRRIDPSVSQTFHIGRRDYAVKIGSLSINWHPLGLRVGYEIVGMSSPMPSLKETLERAMAKRMEKEMDLSGGTI